MPKSYSNLTFTESAHIGLDDDTPESPLKIKRDDNVSLDSSSSALKIDYNLSGDTSQGGDRLYDAIHIDADSSATGGDATNEVRFTGIRAMVEDSGDANDLYGGYFDARNDKTVANDLVANVFGTYGAAYGRHTAGEVRNIAGGYFVGYTDNADSGTNVTTLAGVRAFAIQTGDSGKTVSNAYGVYGKVDLAASTNNGTFNNADGLYGEIEIDDADSTINSARAVKGIIDSNAGTITSAYQFYGSTSTNGTITTSWGIYSTGASKHYLSGNLGINTTAPGGNLHIVGESGGSGQIYLSDADDGSSTSYSLLINKSGDNAFIYNRDDGQLSFGTNDTSNHIVIANTGNVTFSGDINGDIITLTQSAYSDGYRLIRSGHDTYRIALGDSEGLQIINETDSGRKELRFDGAGNAAFPEGNLTVGSTTRAATTSLTLQTNAEQNTVLNLKEASANYGFSLNYDGTANDFIIKRHDNDATGSAVLTFNRDDDTATFAGKVSGGEIEGTSLDINGNGDVSGSLTVAGNLLLTGSSNIQHAATGGLFDLNASSSKVQLTTNHPEIVFQIDNDHTEPDTEIFQINISTASPAPLKLTTDGLSLNPISNATSDTDKFLVSDSGTIKYRTGAEVRSDIGAGTGDGNVTTSSGVSGYVPFFDSSTNLDTTNKFYFDDTNKRLSINGGTSPSNTLQLGGNGIMCTSSTAEINLEANGDILMGASSTFQVDGDAGAAGKYLESTGSGLQWSTPSTSQTIINSNFDDNTNTTSYQNIPFNYIFESSSQSYYHVFACPAAGTVKRITFMHVHGSMTIGQGSSTTQLRVVKNGSTADTSGELSGDGGSADGSKIVYEPGTSFANGDRLQFQFSRSVSNLYWRGVAVSIVLEFTHV
jgi:hypothetical protein